VKLLQDQGLPRSTIQHLAAVGIAAEHIGELGLATADDPAILQAARQRQSVVVTLDADFHKTLAAQGAPSPSVVRIRIEGLKGNRLAAILAQVISLCSAELSAGAAVTVTASRIRVRALPIGGPATSD
jgi:predicted nuclease of predicted toxin-antitoxin system